MDFIRSARENIGQPMYGITFDFMSDRRVNILCTPTVDEVQQITKGDLLTDGPAFDLVWSDPVESVVYLDLMLFIQNKNLDFIVVHMN